MKYLLQICYEIEIRDCSNESQQIFDQCDHMTNYLEALLPDEYIAGGICARKLSSSQIKLDEGKNCLRCELCGDLISLPNSGALSSIPEGIKINGMMICKHCAWEQGRGVTGESSI